MSHSQLRIWVHILWRTKHKGIVLNQHARALVATHLHREFEMLGCVVRALHVQPDHVHCLLMLKPTISISELMNRIKGKSSRWITQVVSNNSGFTWQQGFTAYSVSEAVLDRVAKYIADQDRHHGTQSYEEEEKKLAAATIPDARCRIE